jgi:hypothetical protein
MTDDDRLRALVHAAFPPHDATPPAPELWLAVVRRCNTPPRISRLDIGLAALIALGLAACPQWIGFLFFHL